MGTVPEIALAAAAAFAAGIVNALAGGGTLITFPTLTALGVPALTANTTNTTSLVPGYFGGSIAQRGDLSGQRRRFMLLTATGALGGLAGGLLLLWSGERMFRQLTPWLLLFASLLLAAQGWIRRRVLERRRNGAPRKSEAWVAVPVFLAAIYGGYFGGALGVVVLAVLAVMLDDPLPKLNAMKQSISFAVNVTAALVAYTAFLIATRQGTQMFCRGQSLVYFMLAGVAENVCVFLLLEGLSRGTVSIVAPLASVSPIFVLALSFFFLRGIDILNRRIVLGTLLIVSGVYLITALR
jgi:uncharacterized membrane protein YfcA